MENKLKPSLTLFFSLVCLFIVSSFSAGANSITSEFTILPNKIDQSEHDERQYQVIILNNKMKVLLISDKKAVKSLASIALPVGSLYDPKSQQGLAHYTEHMVLMGSQRYPEAASFSQFLSQHSGNHNASTAPHRTAFYFEVENSAYPQALDRLADAIASPILDPNNANKERNAVNAELTIARSNDGFRIGQVDSETINQKHPSAMFSGGNLETLSDKPDSILQTELTQFHHRYYSANIMVGVLYSNQSLEQLAKLASQTFGRIKNNHVKVPPITETALTPNETGKLIYMIPAQPKKVLYIQFPIENNLASFAEKSDEYISYMISNRGTGTLYDLLQKQGLIESLSSRANPIRYGNSGVFSISVSLTEEGLKKRDKVISAIFHYLNVLKEKGVDSIYYNEIKNVLALSFRYPDINRDMEYVEWLSDQMLLYPIEHILDSDFVMGNFNQQAIKQRLDMLTLDNARIWVIAPNQQTNKEAYFVNAPYRIETIKQEQKSHWIDEGKNLTFVMPKLNPYIPTDFTIIPQQAKTTTRIEFSSQGNHIHFPSHYFSSEPKAKIVLSLRNDQIFDDINNRVMFSLLDYIVNRESSLLQFQALVAGMSLSTQFDSGLMVSVSGFNQHTADLVLSILSVYYSSTINDENLALAKEWYLQQLDAQEHVNSYSLAMQPVNALSSKPYFSREDKRQTVKLITPAMLEHFRSQLLFDAVPYMMSLGNLSSSDSQKLYQEVKSTLNQKIEYKPKEEIDVGTFTQALFTQYANSTDHALFVGFIPKQYDSIESRAYSYLLNKIASTWFYDQLRSKEQLGYAVFSLPVRVGKSSGIGFLVQSNQYDPAYLNERYLAFYPVIKEKLSQLTEQEFKQYRQSLIDEISMPPQTLDEEMARYLGDYYRSHFDFDTRDQLLNRIKSVSKVGIVDFYQEIDIGRGLIIYSQVIGQQADKERINKIDSIQETIIPEVQKTLEYHDWCGS